MPVQETVVLDKTFGTGDLGARLNVALHSRPRRNVVWKVPAGNYVLNNTVWLGDADNLTLDLRGVRISVSAGVTAFSIGGKGSTGLTVRGGVLHGGSSCFGAYAPNDQVTQHLTLAFDECADTSGAGISLYDNGTHWNNFRDVLIDGGYFHNTGAENILISGVDGLRLLNMRLTVPSTRGPNKGAQPVNVDVGAAKHVLIKHNVVSGTPLWNNTPFEYNSPGSGIYVVEAQDVHVIENTVQDSQCTAAKCRVSGPYGSLPDADYGRDLYGADGIHLDTVIDGEIRNNQVSDYVRGIVNEVGMNVVVANNRVSRSWTNGLHDSSRFEEVVVNSLQTAVNLVGGRGVTVSTDNAIKQSGTGSLKIEVPEAYKGLLLQEQFGERRKLKPIAELWIDSSTAEEAGALELWISRTDRVAEAENKLPLPALTGNGWQDVKLFAETMPVLDSESGGVKSWGLVAVKPLHSKMFHVEQFTSILNAFNNVYLDNVIQSTGMQAFSSTGCGDHTVIRHNTIRDPGAMGASTSIWFGAAISIEPRGKTCLKSDVLIEENTISSSKGTLLDAGKYVPIALSGPYADGGVLSGVRIQGNVLETGAGMNRPAALYKAMGGVVRDVHVLEGPAK